MAGAFTERIRPLRRRKYTEDMSGNTLLRVDTGSSKGVKTPDRDLARVRQILSRPHPTVVAADSRTNAAPEGVGAINERALLRSRLDGRQFLLPVRFHNRLILGTTSELSGTDDSGRVSVRLAGDSLGDTLRFSISAVMPDTALPSEILPFAQLIRCAQHGETIDLSFAGRSMVGSVMSLPEEDIDEFDSYVDLVERMDRFQQMTGSSFPMPSRFSGRELDELDTAERLLTGSDVEWEWAQATVVMTEDPRDRLGLDPDDPEMNVSIGGDYFVEIAGESILIGQVLQTLTAGSMNVSPSSDGSEDVDVELRPGKNPIATARLTSRAHFDPYDRRDTERVEVSAVRIETLEQIAERLGWSPQRLTEAGARLAEPRPSGISNRDRTRAQAISESLRETRRDVDAAS